MAEELDKSVTLDWLLLSPTDTIVFDDVTGLWRNEARAQRVINFIEQLNTPSGVGAGESMRTREFQRSFIRDVYEPCHADGRRVVRDGILSIARKNGKTALIAAFTLVHLVGPEAVMNGEVYSAANDKDQAAIIYKFAAQFVRGDDELPGYLSCIDSTKRIICTGNGTLYRALSRESSTKHGLNPTVAIYDELAQARDRELYDTLNTAFGAREEPLFVVISTQSRDPQHIMSELIDAGLGDDPTVVCHLYSVPDDDDIDIFDESVWYFANPALGDFLMLDSLRKLAQQARDSPSFESPFRNLNLNQRVDHTPSLISRTSWEACECADGSARLDPGESIYLGLDLSSTTDLCSLAAVSVVNGDRVESWSWKPADLVRAHAKRDRAHYEVWVKEGYLLTSPGGDVDYDLVALKIAELDDLYDIKGIAFDRWRIDVLMKCFDRLGIATYYGDDYRDGIRFVEWGQGFKDMAPAVDALDKAVANRSLAHHGQPVLTWCVGNATVVTDPAGNRKLDKSKARFRIDAAVALTMALGLKARDMPEPVMDIDEWLNDVVSV